MNNNTCTYKRKTYIRVTKVHARHLFNAGERLVITPKSDKKYVVWSRGGTSETTTKQAHWRYCELVENEN